MQEIDLVAESEHLAYEIAMLLGTAEELQTAPESDITKNALLESFAIHARSLFAFYFGGRRYCSDVIAQDYVDDWNTVRPGISPILNDVKSRTDKEIVHLTTERMPGIQLLKNWNYGDISHEFHNVTRIFIQHAKPQKMGPDFLELIPRVSGEIKVVRGMCGSTSTCVPDNWLNSRLF